MMDQAGVLYVHAQRKIVSHPCWRTKQWLKASSEETSWTQLGQLGEGACSGTWSHIGRLRCFSISGEILKLAVVAASGTWQRRVHGLNGVLGVAVTGEVCELSCISCVLPA